ncbi:MAG: dTDP-4-dehydrorhamnose reductase [Alphaproteobacteria bacterium]|jgi:dTDP-4-dehydrorhamnose reductase|nr:dTDP-4-dehydrorhamnose reductase [Alphaproteobacteria bacterium]
MTPRVLIIGENGQVAQALARTYSARGTVVAAAGRSKVDITDRNSVLAAVSQFHPDLVINAAAYTAVDKAEDDADQAFLVNRDGARHVAAAARAAAAPLIHISTDYVFDGAKTSPYVETDEPGPLGVYGHSKLAGEMAVAAETNDHVIVRTSWVCSPDGHNFVKTMLRLAAERDEVKVVDDQWGAPTFAADLAVAIAAVGDRLIEKADRSTLCGTYHATGSGETTWCRFASAIMEWSAAKRGRACRVHAISTSEYPTRARRPQNSRLDCSKLDRVFAIRLPMWRKSLETCLEQLFELQGSPT